MATFVQRQDIIIMLSTITRFTRVVARVKRKRTILPHWKNLRKLIPRKDLNRIFCTEPISSISMDIMINSQKARAGYIGVHERIPLVGINNVINFASAALLAAHIISVVMPIV